MQNILFVCLGNIARSTMAEAMFHQMVQEAGLSAKIAVDSAGTSNWEVGNPPHPGTQGELFKHNIPFNWIKARQIKPKDFAWADYIITMDEQNVDDLMRKAPNKEAQQKIHMAYDILPGYEGKEIPDPWYSHRFDVTFDQLSETLPAWLNKIAKELD